MYVIGGIVCALGCLAATWFAAYLEYAPKNGMKPHEPIIRP